MVSKRVKKRVKNMLQERMCVVRYFGYLYPPLRSPNFPQNSAIDLQFFETLNLNNSGTIPKKEDNILIFTPL